MKSQTEVVKALLLPVHLRLLQAPVRDRHQGARIVLVIYFLEVKRMVAKIT